MNVGAWSAWRIAGFGLVSVIGLSGCARSAAVAESARSAPIAAERVATADEAVIAYTAQSAVHPQAAAASAAVSSEHARCVPDPAATPAAGAPAAASSRRYVNVNVATLWRTPQAPRELDEPSLRMPTDIPAWLSPQSIRDKLALVGRTETEVLYGEPVELLEERGDWVRVAVPAQRTPLNERGYPGWLPKRQLTERSEAAAYTDCSQARVTKPTAWLYEDAARHKPLLQISFGTRLPVLEAQEAALLVMTPEGAEWLAAADAAVVEAGRQPEPPSGEQLIALGKQFLGLPYLWAGASGFGFDCSGFTYSMYRYYGIELPRDAKDQAKTGRSVGREQLRPGDLLFFAYEKGRGAVHHVALYAGNGMMLHSPKTERTVELLSFATPEYAAEFAGARRVLPDR